VTLRRFLASLTLFAALWCGGSAFASQQTWVTPGAPLSMSSLATFLNNAFQAVGTFNSGTTSPTVGPSGAPIANMAWWNTNANPNVLEFFDGTQWVSTGMSLNTSTHAWTFVSPSITTSASIFRGGIGVTSSDGLLIYNNSAATNGNQQWSPRLHWYGEGWQTSGTPQTQIVDVIAEIQPLQGTSAPPSAALVFSTQSAAAGYNPQFTILDANTNSYPSVIIGAQAPSAYAGAAQGDLGVGRGAGTGFIFFGGNNVYLGYNSGAWTFTGGGLPLTGGGTGATTQQGALNNIAPTATRAGDIIYWNGSNWTHLAGNNSGTLTLQENASGVPSWASVAGTGTVTSITITASGGAVTSGTCPSAITTSGTCNIAAPGGFLNVLRNSSFSAWFHGCVASACTITTAGGWCAEGVWVLPTGASVTCQQITATTNSTPYYSMKITGAASVTDVKLRFVVESLQADLISNQNVTFQVNWINGTGGTVTPTLQTRYASAQDNWGTTATDLAATNMQACTSTSECTEAYTLAVSNLGSPGYDFNVDLGNNFSTTGKTATIVFFDARVTPGVSTGANSNPPPFEMRDPESDLRWNERFYQASYDNGVAPGTATTTGLVGGTSCTSTPFCGQAWVQFRTPMRCSPPSMSTWDGAGNSGKLSTTAGGAGTTFTNNVAASLTASFISSKGFGFAAAGGSTAGYEHYTADCTISGG
jgi:hypothetical protein